MTTTLSRRSFFKGMSAAVGAAMLPSISLLRAARVPQIDLLEFCDDFSVRWDIKLPFHQDGLTYATDGRIAVRTPLVLPQSDDPRGRLPNMSQYDFWQPTQVRWQPWPGRKLIADRHQERFEHTCPICAGKGRVGPGVRRCSKCGGYGFTVDDEIACESQCTVCETGYLGGVECDYCDGHGNTRRPAIQVIGAQLIGGQFDAKIRALENVEWQPGRNPNCDPVRFRFHGGEGVLMPIARDW